MRSLVFVFLAAVATSIGGAKAESIESDAQSGFEVCTEHFAFAKRGRKALEAEGWKFQGTADAYQWLTKNHARSVIALGRNSGREPQGCFASFHGMTVKNAMAFAVSQARRLGLRRMDVADAPFGMVWFGSVLGKDATMTVLDSIQYERHRGAAVVLLEQ